VSELSDNTPPVMNGNAAPRGAMLPWFVSVWLLGASVFALGVGIIALL